MKHLIICSFSVNCSCPWLHALVRPRPTTYHAGVNCSLLDISSDTSHKGVAVLKVGVEVGLWGDGNNPDYRTNHCFTALGRLHILKAAYYHCKNCLIGIAAKGISNFLSLQLMEWPEVCVCTALTWYMTEEGRGSMHGCWSGRGSSSSRSTLESASSNVTADVMVLPRKTSVRVK